MKEIQQHNIEINENLKKWNSKPLLRKIYNDFYKLISESVNPKIIGKVVEIGSGIGNIKSVLKDAVTTDIFDNPWIDKVENAYRLSFEDESISSLILFDVFHHLEFPGNALDEFFRVLNDQGRIVIFEPDNSMLGLIVYGLFHHEPTGLKNKITYTTDAEEKLINQKYYASEFNANRIFLKKEIDIGLKWRVLKMKRIAGLSYVLSGGYSKPSFYPEYLLGFMYLIDKLLSKIPFLFSTRLLIVLEKNT